MKQPIVKGHPLHAIMTDLPAAGFTLSYGLDLLSLWTNRKEQFRDAATINLAAAVGGGAVAGLLGWWDFLAIPADHPARKPALIHGLLNSSLLLVGGANLVARKEQPATGGTAPLPFWISTGALGVLLFSAWLGGSLVYHLGWRVKPAEKLELMEAALKKDGHDSYAGDAQRQVDQYEKESALVP